MQILVTVVKNSYWKGRNKMSVVHLTSENFSETVEKEGVVAVIDFYADWCGPCKMFAPVFEELAQENDTAVFAKVNVDNEESIAIKYGVMSIPTVVVLKDGVEIARNVGLAGKQKILDMISK